jgi:hypothetical protein
MNVKAYLSIIMLKLKEHNQMILLYLEIEGFLKIDLSKMKDGF